MIIPFYQIDAFTDKLFTGNPAAVCILDSWLSEALMQQIAAENNLSETAFVVSKQTGYELRWFTPTTEVNLCGHATLAAAYVIFNYVDRTTNLLRFKSNSGDLIVSKDNDSLILNFPIIPIDACHANTLITQALNVQPLEIWKGSDYIAVLENETQVRDCFPNLNLIAQLDACGLIITAPGKYADFVSRCFAPQDGINEDPVTGSAHCMLAPYWATRLNKTKLYAEQLSARSGKMYCEIANNRILLTGKAVLYLRGTIEI